MYLKLFFHETSVVGNILTRYFSLQDLFYILNILIVIDYEMILLDRQMNDSPFQSLNKYHSENFQNKDLNSHERKHPYGR